MSDNEQHQNDAIDNSADVKEEGASDNESAAAIESAWIVKLRGLPWSVTTQDILDFLDGVEVSGDTNGVHLITYSRNSSRPNGEAFVVCATEESYNKAFEYNKKTMGHRYIEIFSASYEDFENILRKQTIVQLDTVVKLRGLPWRVTEKEIADFFQGMELSDENGIHIHMDRSGRASGEAFVQFKTAEDCEKALKRNLDKIGHRYIEIFRSTSSELRRSMNQSGSGDGSVESGGNTNNIGGNYGGNRGGYNNRSTPYDRNNRGDHGGNQRMGGYGNNNGGNNMNRGNMRGVGGNQDRSFSTMGGNSWNNNGNNGGNNFGNNFGNNGGAGNNFRGNNNNNNGNNMGGNFGNNGGGSNNNNFGGNNNGGNNSGFNPGGFGGNNFGNSGGGFGNNNAVQGFSTGFVGNSDMGGGLNFAFGANGGANLGGNAPVGGNIGAPGIGFNASGNNYGTGMGNNYNTDNSNAIGGPNTGGGSNTGSGSGYGALNTLGFGPIGGGGVGTPAFSSPNSTGIHFGQQNNSGNFGGGNNGGSNMNRNNYGSGYSSNSNGGSNLNPGVSNNQGGNNSSNNSSSGGSNLGSEQFRVHLRGMPFYCDEMDIIKFFAPLKPVNCKVIYNNKNMHSGGANAYFATHADAMEALKRDKEMMGSRYIELLYDSPNRQGGRRF